MHTVKMDTLRDVLYSNDLFYDEIDDLIRTDYSGRGMYGESCFAFTGSLGQLLLFAHELALVDRQAGEWIENVRQDQLGLGMVYYWPGVEVEDES